MLRTSPPPSLMVQASVQEADSSSSSQPTITMTHSTTPTPAGLQSPPGETPPTSAAGGAYHTANVTIRDIQYASEATSANEKVPTAAAATIDEVGARMASMGYAATAADYTIVCHVTLAVTYDLATAAAAGGCPTLNRDAIFDVGGGSGARSVIAVTRPARLPPPRPSPATPAEALEGRSSASGPTPESPLPPPRIASPTSTASWKPPEVSEDFFVCYEALAAPMVHLGS